MKRVAAALIAACLMSLSACQATQEEDVKAPEIATDGTPVEDAMAQSIKLSAAQTLGATMEQLIVQEALSEAQGDMASAGLYNAQIEVRHELGEVKAVDIDNATVVLLADGSYTVMMPVTFTEGAKQYVLNLNMATQEIKTEFTAISSENDGAAGGSLMESAVVYSAIGIGTVFAVLIFISLLIACFKFIHKWETGLKAAAEPSKAQAEPVKAAASVNTIAAPAADEDLSGDAELAAVIAAAIAAYEGTSSNGLVVRSIRRVQKVKGR